MDEPFLAIWSGIFTVAAVFCYAMGWHIAFALFFVPAVATLGMFWVYLLTEPRKK